jgi:hypothetical protein
VNLETSRHPVVMTDENSACCYLLVENRTPAQVAALLHATLAEAMRSEREASLSSAPWPSAGAVDDTWTIIIDPHFEFGDADADLQQWSAGTRVARLQFIEREKFSHASVWAHGELTWEVSFEPELDERPVVSPDFPYVLGELAQTIDAVGDPETWYQVPAVAVQQLTGWRVSQSSGDGDQLWFTELHYPRPAGVIAAIVRDRAGEPPDDA